VASGTTSRKQSLSNVNLSFARSISRRTGSERIEEWRELIDEIHESIDQMGYAFVPIVAHKVGDDAVTIKQGIRRAIACFGTDIDSRDDQKIGAYTNWDELVQYAHSGRSRVTVERGSPTMGGFDVKARAFQEKLNAYGPR